MSSSNSFLKALSSFFKFAPSPDALQETDVHDAITEAPVGNDAQIENAAVAVVTRPRDVQVASIGDGTTVLRSRTWDRLKFEVEYGRQKGTTANAYLIQADKVALLDPPGESFTEIFLKEVQQHTDLATLDYVIVGHVNPNRITTLKRLLALAPQATVICSKPAAIALRAVFADSDTQIKPIRGDEVLDLGQGHELRFVFVPTPRWHDALCTYDPATRTLFTDKFFGAHICDEAVLDENWKQLDEDRHYYFDCLHAAQTRQVEAALDKFATFAKAKLYAPGHGPMVRYSLSRLTYDYREWSQQQKTKDLMVALLYTSAYGNTATIGQAIAKGIAQTGVSVECVNCEFTDPAEITSLIERCDGFVIGSPTLGGHAPTQIQTALGIILSTAPRTHLAGVFGSYGWSGEAVDQIEEKLKDSGYRLGFETLRIKFKPTDETLQQCEAAGTEFAQSLRKEKRIRAPYQTAADGQTDRTGQAVGRVTGSLCVLTAQQDDTKLGVLTSWVSQASFNPPGLTIAIAKEQTADLLAHTGEPFVLNILKQGKNLRRYFLKPPGPGEDPFSAIATETANNGSPVLSDALAYLECTVQNRIECGDHWLLYAVVDQGKVLDAAGVTAVNHRKSALQH
ncbi:diflavin flavoprotein [Stenomitos frigidus]|uniref:Flavin oxidoreductase n=1 Tax=Stenomitos frigidus ULC18 TaxID=2107698 RepID=A0A2T1E9X0_9CYAN|nr:diflavin flavoprotein [Stenomitos frigidus]PSB29547.1 flavin oxidoreductase [Stenomitos frigidus ULC18]